MTTKSSIKYASIDALHVKNTDSKKPHRKSAESKFGSQNSRRSQSLDRFDDNSGDSRDGRRNRRQFMHLVGRFISTIDLLNILFATFFQFQH